MLTVTAYRCEHCRTHARVYASKSACKEHEARCFDNPASRSCATCRFKAEGREEIQPGHFKAAYSCTARKPGKCLTTLCPSWQLRVDKEPLELLVPKVEVPCFIDPPDDLLDLAKRLGHTPDGIRKILLQAQSRLMKKAEVPK